MVPVVPPIERRVDAWEMRCRFNRARYWQRLQSGEFLARSKSRPARPTSGQPPGITSEEVYYIDRQTNTTLARVHQYVLPGGGLGAGGKPDPKFVRLDDIEYHLHPGGGAHSDPSLNYPEGYARWAYVVWRRVKCLLIGR
jgi:hypothetical protein